MEMPAVLISWRAGCPHRQSALNTVLALYAQHHPDWPVHVGEHNAGPWCKALAVMAALSQTEADVLIVADADVWTDGLDEAVRAVEDGAPWAIPHLNVCRLAENGSQAERPYRGIEGGGIVVIRREIYESCPLDPRFAGWGQEDESWGVSLTCLHGPPWRGAADLTHYWHPPQERGSRTRGCLDSWRLRKRYFRAGRDPAAMRDLIGEHLALTAPEPAVHDHPQPAVR